MLMVWEGDWCFTSVEKNKWALNLKRDVTFMLSLFRINERLNFGGRFLGWCKYCRTPEGWAGITSD